MSKVDVVTDCSSTALRDLTKEEGDEMLRNYIRRCHNGTSHLTEEYFERTIHSVWFQYDG